MSRTDKDRPYWVRANDKTSKHRVAYHNHVGRFGSPFDHCTVDEPETRAPWIVSKDYNPCGHHLATPHVCDPHSVGNRSDRYWVPARADERAYTDRAVKDYNTFGEVDEDYFLQEKTLNGPYGGGWWD